MIIYDISMDIHNNMTVYKNREAKKPKLEVQSNFENSSVYESKLTMNLHTGTHLDASLHVTKDGNTIDTMDLNKVVTQCKVFDLTHLEEKITANDLLPYSIKENDFILFKTKNSYIEDFDYNFVYLEKSGANYLKEKKIKGVGIDCLGIERAQPDHETHKTLLNNSIVILEGLRLKDIPEGEFFLFAAPLKLNNTEASPTRALLVKDLI